MRTLISLDIQHTSAPIIDITPLCALTPFSVVEIPGRTRLDDMHIERSTPSFAQTPRIILDQFWTIQTLDIGLPEIMNPGYFHKKTLNILARPQILNLVPKLENVPYGALDIRREIPLKKKKTYPDLFTRSLPRSLALRRKSQQTRRYLKNKRRPIALIIASFFCICAPLLFYIKYSVEHGYGLLLELQHAHTLEQIHKNISGARQDFERAKFLFSPFFWLPSEMIALADHAIEGGRLLTRSLDTLLNTLPTTSYTGSLAPVVRTQDDMTLYRAPSQDIFFMENIGIATPTKWLSDSKNIIANSVDDLLNAGKFYAEAPGNGAPAEAMRKIGKLLGDMTAILQGYVQNEQMILSLLGSNEPKRYILFNQNRDEIRANGGFPGSIISFTFYKGNILDYRRDDVYYYDWNLYPHKEVPPPGIALLTNNYGLRDVNYYPDFRTTLEKANNFIERSGDSTVNVGIAIHQGLIEDILQVIGPVKVAGVDIPFESSNFSLLMSILVENQFARDKTPKDILFQFIEEFGKQVLASKKWTEIGAVLQKEWSEGEVLLAARDDATESFLKSLQKPLPWETDDKNWAYPVFTSVSGNKSDRYIKRNVQVKTEHIGNCKYKNTLDMTLEHTYSDQDAAGLTKILDTFGLNNPEEREKMKFIQGGGKNQAFVRVYVPKGAQLIDTPGVDVDESAQTATTFSFMLDTEVGKTSEKTLQYTLNIPLCIQYNKSVSLYHQPGLQNSFAP